jgi:tetratricopeptide (TPR) repeat protein
MSIERETRLQLEQERDFLMKSLDDLELEHESGGIDDESYTELHDDYTARAAAVLRTLRDDIDARPPPPVRSRRVARTRVATVAVIVVFALVAGVSLAFALGARLPGQTASGNSGGSTSTTNGALANLAKQITALQAQVNASPNDFDLRLQLARAYEANGDVANALKQSDAAITIDPNRAEGHANAARLLYLASEQVASGSERNQLVAQALAGFDKAVQVNPDFADAYYFRAVLYAFASRDYLRSQIDLQNYLVRAPNGPWASQARSLLTQVTNALESPSTTVPPSTTKPKSTPKHK